MFNLPCYYRAHAQVFDCISCVLYTHQVFVEVDEQQHEDLRPKHPSGAVIAPHEVPADQPDQERERMMDIVMAQTKPVVFIRYNPDRYMYAHCCFYLLFVLFCESG